MEDIMKKASLSLLLLIFFLAPLKALSQEDTCLVPDLYGTTLTLNTLIAQDTAGTGWQGAAGATAWQNGTRVYVLKMNGYYPSKTVINISANRKLVIRAEYGVPEVKGSVYKPSIVLVPSASGGNPPGNFMQLNGAHDTVIFKNIMIAGYDEGIPGNLDALQGALITMPAVGSGSIFVDSCILKSVNGQLIRTDGRPNTVRITNSIFADMGFLGTSNFGAGKGIDLRGSEVDTIDMHDNTFVNWQDRIIRHYLSTAPIHNLYFTHNTCVNGMSFHGFLSLGWCDSTGNGTFQIKNNLLVDHFSLGADTDVVRQAEYTDPGELDSLNGNPRMSWILARPNPLIHWDISNNYYVITDSGKYMRDSLNAPYVPRVYKGNDPYLPYGMNARLQATGGDSVNCFKKVNVAMTNVPPLMTELIRWYRLPRAMGGAGKEKRGASGVGDPNFVKTAPGVWTFDYHRRDAYWYTDSLNCKFSGTAVTLASMASSDAQVVGDPRWGAPVMTTTPVTVSSHAITYGTVNLPTSKKDSIQLTNIGPNAVHFKVTSTKAAFVAASDSVAVNPGTSKYLVITFTPPDTNSQSGYIKLVYDALGSPDSVAVSGKGRTVVRVDDPQSLLPTSFSLAQNYPNPFNPSTQISYAVPKSSKITLEIFDVLGKKVATLVNGIVQPGFYTANFNASSMSSGIYFYRLSSPGAIFTKKMMLLK